MKQKNFIKTNEGQNIIWLDYCGYHLCSNQGDMTLAQQKFISEGRAKLYKQMNEVKTPKGGKKW